MKTLKVTLTMIVIMFLNQLSYSYDIYITSPRPCVGFPSSIIHPTFTLLCDFEIVSAHIGDSDTIHYKIYVEQHGQSGFMGEGIVESGDQVLRNINLQNLPFLCHNELVTVRIDARRYDGGGITYSNHGFFIWYKSGPGCNYYALTNGSWEFVGDQWMTFFNGGPCTLASGTYAARRYKITYTLNGDFRDSIPVVDTNLCMGYNGAGPNLQFMWGRKISQTNTQAIFINFVYEVYSNTIGQYMGWRPCRREEATIVYHYVRKPVINSLHQLPNPFYHSGLVLCKLQHGNGFLEFDWKDTNRTSQIQFIPNGQYAQIIRNFAPHADNSAVPPYRVKCRVKSEFWEPTPWKEIDIFFVNTPPHTCPTIRYVVSNNKIDENSILILSPSKPGVDVSDYYLVTNPQWSEEDLIEFSIYEPARAVTNLDQLEVWQAFVNHNEEVAVTNDGKIINFEKSPGKGKILLNESDDVSGTLAESDNIAEALKKGDKLEVSFDGGGNFIVVDLSVPNDKDKPAGVIRTKSGTEYEFLSRNNKNTVCIEVDENNFNGFVIEALQSFSIDRIAIEQDKGTAEIVNLNFKYANDKEGDISDVIRKDDNVYCTINNNNEASFGFTNNLRPNKSSFYILKSEGRYINSESAENNIRTKDTDFPFANKLFDNSPNPFNPTTNIRFEIKNDAMVKIAVYDIAGREVKLLVNDFKTAGKYELTFDGSDFASGIYFYKMQAGSFIETKRMILIK